MKLMYDRVSNLCGAPLRLYCRSTTLSILCLSVWAIASTAYAQTSAELGIQTHAGLSITGAVGTVYSIES